MSFNLIWKVFLIWLVLHFFLHTFITFFIGLELSIIWLWKEFIVIWLFLALLYFILKHKDISFISRDKTIFYLEITFLLLILYTFFINYFVINSSLTEYIYAFRYDFAWYLIFFIVYRLSYFIKPWEYLLKFYWKIIKVILILAILWYMIIFAKPWWLQLFGYDNTIFEWEVWASPPAAYYTQYNQWFVRNQFVFERPINYWFFLVAFFPLFYVLYLRKRSFKKTWFWWWVYGFNVMSTFSRAAWWAWFVELIILAMIDYRKNIKRFLKYILLPISIIIAWFVYFAYDHVVWRQRSNTGHIQEVLIWWDMFTNSPIIWKWAWYVWPASFWWDGIEFNTENQFLQIAVEFGIIWFLLWFAIYLFFVLYWFYAWYKADKKEKENKYLIYLLAFSIWMLWLSIQWMVLHSFVDNMIVFPFMFLFAIVIYLYRNKK